MAMSNSYKSISKIISEIESVGGYLKDAEKYYAHTPAFEIQKPETLEEHIELVLNYFQKLVEIHHLDAVIDGLIDDYLNANPQKEILGSYLKKLFVNVILYHDFGKVNQNFQANRYKMNNPFFKGKEIIESPIGTKHSSLGAFIFLCKHFDEIGKKFEQKHFGIPFSASLLFSYSIFKHHSKYIDDDYPTTIIFEPNKEVLFLKEYLKCYGFEINEHLFGRLGALKKTFFENTFFSVHLSSYALYSLFRLNFSLLTASDYLATAHYMNDWKEMLSNFGTLSKERINEIYKNVTDNEWLDDNKTKRNYNRNTYQNLNEEIEIPKTKNGANLNVVRQIMATEVIKNVRKNIDKNLFYIEAPTGGGKTNLSLLATMELLKNSSGNLNKVYYIFPFTTLITQTYKAVKETLGLHENELIELHSKAGFKSAENEEDDQYGNEKKNYIDYLFANYPFCLMTHIKFFDILKTNEKETNYLLHRLANSVVVIDELQSYNPQHWDKVIYFIRQYAKAFNIKFILMSATLPKLDKLNVIKNQVNDFVYLLPEAKKKYFQNPNFSDRVEFNFDLLKKEEISLNEIAEKLIDESKKYAPLNFGDAKPEGSIYTIIEFIFKKSASEFFEIIESKEKFFDEVFLLSGTIIEHRRREIINFLKNKKNRKKKILLITTQVVEAGVDIDMDLGFKDTSLIDSDEQLAGRIKRNVNKENCMLFLFNHNKECFIYGKDKRLEFSKPKYLSTEERQQILKEKDFDLLYDLVMNDRNEWNCKEMVQNFSDYESHINNLRFESIHKDFKLIDQNNISCFIPLSIPVFVKGTTEDEKDFIFSEFDLEFLSINGIFPNANDCIEGSEVFDLYINLIKNKIDFTTRKIKEKALQGIMSKFVFSLFASPKVEQQIIHYSDEEKSEYGYKYVRYWEYFYSVKAGMSDSKFHGNETQFL